jgi:hypothetical protein
MPGNIFVVVEKSSFKGDVCLNQANPIVIQSLSINCYGIHLIFWKSGLYFMNMKFGDDTLLYFPPCDLALQSIETNFVKLYIEVNKLNSAVWSDLPPDPHLINITEI